MIARPGFWNYRTLPLVDSSTSKHYLQKLNFWNYLPGMHTIAHWWICHNFYMLTMLRMMLISMTVWNLC